MAQIAGLVMAALLTATLPGHVYTLRYIDDREDTVVLDDRGTDYDRRCLKVREFSEGTGC